MPYVISLWKTIIFSNHVYHIISKINALSSSLDIAAECLFIKISEEWVRKTYSFIKKSRISRSVVNEKQNQHPDTLCRWKYYVKYRHRDIKFLSGCFLTNLYSRPATCCLLKNMKQMFFRMKFHNSWRAYTMLQTRKRYGNLVVLNVV